VVHQQKLKYKHWISSPESWLQERCRAWPQVVNAGLGRRMLRDVRVKLNKTSGLDRCAAVCCPAKNISWGEGERVFAGEL